MPFPGRAGARQGGDDGGLDLLPSAPILGRRSQEQRPTGQRHDSKPVSKLHDGLAVKVLLADKGYDSYKIIQVAQKQGMGIIIA